MYHFMLWAIIAVLLVLVIFLYRKAYHFKYDGAIVTVRTPEKTIFSLEYYGDTDEIPTRSFLRFNVIQEQPEP